MSEELSPALAELEKELPPAIFKKLEGFDLAEQEMFVSQYKAKRKNIHVAFIFFLFGLHYLYLGKIVVWLLFIFTAGLFGIWYLVDLFRAKGLIQKANHDIAMKCFAEVKMLA